MNTPLMELIEWLKAEDEICPFYKRLDPEFQIRSKATELLEKERQIIIDAYHINPNESVFGNVGSDYYTKTFTNESK